MAQDVHKASPGPNLDAVDVAGRSFIEQAAASEFRSKVDQATGRAFVSGRTARWGKPGEENADGHQDKSRQ